MKISVRVHKHRPPFAGTQSTREMEVLWPPRHRNGRPRNNRVPQPSSPSHTELDQPVRRAPSHLPLEQDSPLLPKTTHWGIRDGCREQGNEVLTRTTHHPPSISASAEPPHPGKHFFLNKMPCSRLSLLKCWPGFFSR